jgi:hypothetical protein
LRNANAAERAAVEFGQSRGIPVDLATASGNPVIRGAQKLAEHTSLAGSFVGRKAGQAQAAALERVGRDLAGQVSKVASVPETAGAAVTSSVERVISKLRTDADVAYDSFRTAAELPKNQATIRIGTKSVDTGVLDASGNPVSRTVPLTKQVAMPVDMRPIKASLQPLYDEMRQWLEPAKRSASAGYTAIESILKGDDFIAAPIAEKGLGGLKSLAREAESADLRNVSQGIAAKTTAKLQSAIDAAATKAGPDVVKALREGRTAHAAKMEAADVLGQLRDEPVQVFNQATWARDAGIDRLRAVAKLAPREMANIGRAFIEKLIDTATAEGGFDKARTVHTAWENLGPATKQILFRNPVLVTSLDNFFLLAKKAAENPNPSGSAYVGGLLAHGYFFRDPVTAIQYELAGGTLAKMLRSPKVARLLTRGLTVPLGRNAESILLAHQIAASAGRFGATPTPVTAPR